MWLDRSHPSDLICQGFLRLFAQTGTINQKLFVLWKWSIAISLKSLVRVLGSQSLLYFVNLNLFGEFDKLTGVTFDGGCNHLDYWLYFQLLTG